VPHRPDRHPAVILVMGVAGCGKTTVGRALAQALDCTFVDADDLHAAQDVERMRRGEPLDDVVRGPWLRRVHDAVGLHLADGRRVVLACSALKAAHRSVLLSGVARSAVVHLRADRSTLERRLRTRPGHFMPASLLDSQLATLEPPVGAIELDAGLGVDELVSRITRRLAEGG
jgi:gluconokinase